MMGEKNYQRAWITRYIIGVILLSITGVVSYFIVYDYARKYYYNQLEDLIVNRYLEGNEAIGAYSYSTPTKVQLNPPGKYSGAVYDYLAGTHKMMPDRTRYFNMFPEGTFYNMNIIDILSDETKYKWWAGTDFLECIIIKKTKEGFDFINEGIVGIGFNLLWFPTDVETTTNTFGEQEYYLKDFSLCNQYVNDLLSNKYRNIKIKRDSDNKKYYLLEELRMKYAVSGNKSLYFGNRFFELRPNQYFEYIGDGIMRQQTSTFGNTYNNLYVTTVTTHYSIQECGDELKNTIFKYVAISFGITIIVLTMSILYLSKYRKISKK